jgi:predicted nucleic acid-binding protein
MTPAELFARHQVVALDSNVLIYLLEGSGPLADAAEALVDGIEEGTAAGVLASVALTEILTRPASLGDGVLFERYGEELRAIPNLRVVGLDAETAIDAAWGRSGHRDLGDAIHVATARRAGATCLVTNDSRVRGRAGVEVVSLADIVPGDSGQEGEATSLRRPQDAEVPPVERE